MRDLIALEAKDKEIARLQRRAESLVAQNERLRAALEFYSKPEHYLDVRGPIGLGSYQIAPSRTDTDGGEIARKALEGK
jgi:hypothetical protein